MSESDHNEDAMLKELLSFNTGNILYCGCRIELATYITMHLVLRKHFSKCLLISDPKTSEFRENVLEYWYIFGQYECFHNIHLDLYIDVYM